MKQFIVIAGICGLLLYSCTPAEPVDPNSAAKENPIVYWRVTQVGSEISMDIAYSYSIRLFEDGSITAYNKSLKLAVRSPQGVWSDAPVPAEYQADYGKVTWYQDKNNYAGNTHTNARGWAVINGKSHTYSGPTGIIRGLLPDGSLLFDTNVDRYLFLQTWKLGPEGSTDLLDIHNYQYEDMSKLRYVAKLAHDGSVLLRSYTYDAAYTGPAVVKGSQLIFSSAGQGSWLGSDEIFYVQDIDRTTGKLVGSAYHRPAIFDEKNIDYLETSDGIGIAYATNTNNDAIYWINSDKGEVDRMRLQGKIYSVDKYSLYSLSGISNISSILEMDNSGKLLCHGFGKSLESGDRLYLAKPIPVITPKKFVNIKSTLTSATGYVPADISIENPIAVSGTYSKSSLYITVLDNYSGNDKIRTLSMILTLNNGLELKPGIAFNLPPGGGSVMSISFYDAEKHVTSICNGGSIMVDGINGDSFTAHLNALKFTASGTTFEMSGDVIAQY